MKTKNYEAGLKVLELVGGGAVIGAIASILIVGCLMENTTGKLALCSPFIGGVGGGVLIFIIGLIKDIKIVKRNLQSRTEGLEEEEKVLLLEDVIYNELYPVQLWAVEELKKIGNERAYLVLKKVLKHENPRLRHHAAEAVNNFFRRKNLEG